MRYLPDSRTLFIFDAAARHENFTKAAIDCALSHSAVCRQISKLEDALGLKLFARANRRVTLTDAGREYWSTVRVHLSRLEHDTRQFVRHGGKGRVVELATLPTMATKWLIPLLKDFYRHHSDITVNLAVRTRPFLFSEESFHAAIHHGSGRWPGARCDYLFAEECAAVCSPAFPNLRRLRKGDFRDAVLLHQSTRPDAWNQWFAESGGESATVARHGPSFELFTMLSRAAEQGLGVALIPRFLITEELARGSLVVANERCLTTNSAYHFAYPESGLNSAGERFRDWVLAAAHRSNIVPSHRAVA